MNIEAKQSNIVKILTENLPDRAERFKKIQWNLIITPDSRNFHLILPFLLSSVRYFRKQKVIIF